MELDSFFVSVERLKNPKLNGVPLLIGGSSNRGVVASFRYETRAFGIHSAMQMSLAKRLCPNALVISYSKDCYLVTDVIKDHASIYGKASIDEFYLDLTGTSLLDILVMHKSNSKKI